MLQIPEPSASTSILIGHDVDTGTEVRLNDFDRRQGLYIVGKTGTGKTTLIQELVRQDMEQGLGVCVLDPHGDLVDGVLARVPREREADVILLDLADANHPFGLNLFECADLSDRTLVGRVAAQAVDIFEKLWGDISWGPQLAQVLRNCAYTLIENQGYTLAEIRRLLLDERFRSELVANVSSPQVRDFWELEYNPLPHREQQQRVSSTLNKVDEFLSPTVLPIVGFGSTTVDFRQVMDQGKILLVKLAAGRVGPNPVSLVGSMIVAQLFNAALSREDSQASQRRQFNLYADEYPRFATPTFAELLSEARKYGLATTLAHQFRGQLDKANQGATLNAANLIIFAVHGEDAEELAKQLDRTPPPPPIIGQRAKLVLAEDMLSRIQDAHESQTLVQLVHDHFRQMTLDQTAPPRSDGVRGPAFDMGPEDRALNMFGDYGGYLCTPRDIQLCFDLLNRWLTRISGTHVLADDENARALTDILVAIRGYIGFGPQHLYYNRAFGSLRDPLHAGRRTHAFDLDEERFIWESADSPTRRALHEPMLQLLDAPDSDCDLGRLLDARRAYWLNHIEMAIAIKRADIKLVKDDWRDGLPYLREQWQMRNPRLSELSWDRERPAMVQAQAELVAKWEAEIAEQLRNQERLATARAEVECRRAIEFARVVIQLAHEIAANPVFIPSGEYEPIFDRPRTFADMEGEIASSLVGLSKYVARVRVLEGNRAVEHVVHTPEYSATPPSSAVAAMVDRIRARTWAEHCAPYGEVIDSIQRRSTMTAAPSSASATQRRVPIDGS